MEPAEQLVSHHTWLRRLARRMVRSPASADDLVQDTCITALRNAPPDVQMRPWLRSVMRKLAWGQIRSEQRRAQREESFYQATPPISEPDALLEYGVDRARLAEAVETLPEPFRTTVVQRFVEGRTCAEIARAEKVPAGTVRWRQARALELLRGELDGARVRKRARRRHVFWGLPIVGAGERIASHVSQSLLSFVQSKAAWFVLACLAAALGLGILRGSADGPHAGTSARAAAQAHHASGASLHALGYGRRPSGAAALLLTHGAPRLRGSGPFSPASETIVTHDAIDPDELRARRRLLEAIRHRYEPYLDDCELDNQGLVRCDKPPIDSTTPGRPTCESLNHNIAFIDVTRRLNFMSHPYANRFLLAAMIANMTLGTSLGCTLVTDPGGADTKNLEPAGSGSDCTTHEGPDGEVCATCTDPDGAETTMCAPSDCYAQTMPDGALCTTCTDIHGSTKTVCEDGPPKDCVSEVMGFGLLCTTCTAEGLPPETTCSPAQCGVSNYCLACEDPRGNTGTDCSQNYEEMYSASSSIGGGDTFNSCSVTWGIPSGAATTWHYPGLDTCTVSSSEDWYSIECRFPDGSGVGSSGVREPNQPLPDLFAGRPENLPAPGACVDNTSADGAVSCTTCTRQDLSATTTCRHPAAEQCEPGGGGAENAFCVHCRQADGSSVTICDPTDL